MSKYYKAEDVDLVCIKNFANGDVLSAIRNLPTIEVSEDCISREQVRAKLDYISYAEKDPISIAKRIVDDAPSVVPKPKEGERIRQGTSPHCHAKMKGADDETL